MLWAFFCGQGPGVALMIIFFCCSLSCSGLFYCSLGREDKVFGSTDFIGIADSGINELFEPPRRGRPPNRMKIETRTNKLPVFPNLVILGTIACGVRCG